MNGRCGHANPPEREPTPPDPNEWCVDCGRFTGHAGACWCKADQAYEEARDNELLERLEDEER